MSLVPMSVVRVRQDDLERVESLRVGDESWADCLHRLLGRHPRLGERAAPDVRQVLVQAGGPVRRADIATRSGWSTTGVDRALRILGAIQTRQGWILPPEAP